ncbi:hypothetical protein OG894_44615 (plasmid) [Streptomyces sp. NBC_01724]|uniref:hypothetical protein n=1 Tax=Streptomyces sp. NBC_01724 TaxID=2975922 RepID=UPI002E33DC02|nr:hypothetical protein [Streptomyces sp. NBC_01724]
MDNEDDGHVAATLLILHATGLLTPDHGAKTAIRIALGLFAASAVAGIHARLGLRLPACPAPAGSSPSREG